MALSNIIHKSIDDEKQLLKRLADLHNDQDNGMQVTKEDIKSSDAQSILNDMEIDNFLPQNDKSILATKLTKFYKQINQATNIFAARTTVSNEGNVQLKLYSEKIELLKDIVISLFSNNEPLSSFYDDIDDIMRTKLLKISPQDVWDSSTWYPHRNKIHPDRVIPTISNIGTFIGDPRRLISSAIEILSMLRIVKGATHETKDAKSNRIFLEAFINYGLKMINTNGYHDPTIHFVKELTELAMLKVFGIKVDQLNQATKNNLPKLLGLTNANDISVLMKLKQSTKKLIANSLKTSDKLITAWSLRELILEGFAQKHPGLLDRTAKITLATPVNTQKIETIQSVHSGRSAKLSLFSHTLFTFAYPLSVHQGPNPTCFSETLISFMAQRDPELLLNYIEEVGKKGFVKLDYNNKTFSSQGKSSSLVTFAPHLSALSLLLVPEFDVLYKKLFEFDSPQLFKSNNSPNNVDVSHPSRLLHPFFKNRPTLNFTESISLQKFYKTFNDEDYKKFRDSFTNNFHPDRNSKINNTLPAPAGITIFAQQTAIVDGKIQLTIQRAGFHMITIQRITKGPNGDMRVYFYNPSYNDMILLHPLMKPTTWENEEKPGESSLPFDQFIWLVNFACWLKS